MVLDLAHLMAGRQRGRCYRRLAAGLFCCLLGTSLSGCVLRGDLSHPDPAVCIPHMAEAAKHGKRDMQTLTLLVADLSSDDAAVRLYAINALEKLTGNRFEYTYFAGDEQREVSITRWHQWLADEKKAQSSPQPPAAHAAEDRVGG